MKKLVVFLFVLFLSQMIASAQVLSVEEAKLYSLIMEYRNEKGLPRIALSKSLTKVAQIHVKDLNENFKESTICNMHSWSNKGNWTACCYTSDHAQAQCMWNKPRELTTYRGNGYEISYGSWGAPVNAQGALAGWKSSSGHNAVIINSGIWKDDWNAIGIGLSGGYAVVWFGKEYER
jgi:uncharacterized protein YkwD